MFFKNAYLLQMQQPAEPYVDAMQKRLDAGDRAFEACTPSQSKSMGFVPPLGGENMAYHQLNCWFFAVQTETKILPPAVIRDLLNQRVQAIEESQNRKVYRKEKLTLKDEIIQDSLPRAFSKTQVTHGYFDLEHRLLVIDAATAVAAESIANLLRELLGSMPVMHLDCRSFPPTTMTQWLRSKKSALGAFSAGSNCEFVDQADLSNKARLIGHDLMCSEVVQEMLSEGMSVKTLQMQIPGQLKFSYGQPHVIKSIRWADELIADAADSDTETEMDRHAADLAIQIPTLRSLIHELGEVFGGWEQQQTADV